MTPPTPSAATWEPDAPSAKDNFPNEPNSPNEPNPPEAIGAVLGEGARSGGGADPLTPRGTLDLFYEIRCSVNEGRSFDRRGRPGPARGPGGQYWTAGAAAKGAPRPRVRTPRSNNPWRQARSWTSIFS